MPLLLHAVVAYHRLPHQYDTSHAVCFAGSLSQMDSAVKHICGRLNHVSRHRLLFCFQLKIPSLLSNCFLVAIATRSDDLALQCCRKLRSCRCYTVLSNTWDSESDFLFTVSCKTPYLLCEIINVASSDGSISNQLPPLLLLRRRSRRKEEGRQEQACQHVEQGSCGEGEATAACQKQTPGCASC